MTQLPKSLKWRDTLHKTIKQAIYGKQNIGLAQVIVDAIDAAYVQGLEDQGRKANSGRQLYQDGYRQAVEDVIDFIPEEFVPIHMRRDSIGRDYVKMEHIKQCLRDKFLN